MPMMNQRPRARRPASRLSAPSYSGRANSRRRDIQLHRGRRKSSNLPVLFLILLLAAGLLIGSMALIFGAKGKDRPAESPASLPEESAHEAPSLEAAAEAPESFSEGSSEDASEGGSENSSEEISDAAQEGLIYTDDRIPNYVASNPIWETIHFEWESQDKRGTVQIDVSIDREMYSYYRGLGRYYGVDEYQNYINDTNNKAIAAEIVKAIRDDVESHTYRDAATVREIAKFVQDTITYQYDLDTTGEDEYPRYPIETLYERQGDCEDTSILMAALLKESGYEVGFLHLPGHLAVVLRTADDYTGGAYYEIDGHRYLYIESTASGWNIGDIPEDVMNQPAAFYAIP